FETIVQEQFRTVREAKGNKKAVIVTCFTGEGVAAKLYQRIYPVVDQSKVEIIQMQFIEKETFKKHIDGLLEEYEIKAIAGTVEIDYQNIPFFSAYDVFDDNRLNVLKRIVSDEVPIEKIVRSLENTLTHVGSVYHLIESLQRIVHQIQNQLHVIVEPTVDAGLVIHLAFLVESLLKKEHSRTFPNLAAFQKRYRIETDVLRTHLLQIEKNYQIKISEDEIAYLTQMFLENEIKSYDESAHNISV
ncbi:PRD domain-containing protein, partial [Enterococcus faecium]